MAISTVVEYADLDELFLDPKNPRLGRRNIQNNLGQESLLEVSRAWTLEELAQSYLESGGFWTYEALIVVKEDLYGDGVEELVVVEGNRRLAALKHLHEATQGHRASPKWQSFVRDGVPDGLFTRIPYLLAASRDDVQAFLGFRHVTGIKQWDADEKAAFIARLIEDQGFTYEQVMRKIGSNTPAVRQNYIAYRTLLQIEETVEDLREGAEDRFAILYMAIRTQGARQYLQIDISADPITAKHPISRNRLAELANFARWLFGTNEIEPVVTDTRQVSDFGKILENAEAIEYLERTPRPKFDIAFRTAGGDREEIIRLIQQACDNVELALTRAHHYKSSPELQHEVRRFGADALQLLGIFPTIKQSLLMAPD